MLLNLNDIENSAVMLNFYQINCLIISEVGVPAFIGFKMRKFCKEDLFYIK